MPEPGIVTAVTAVSEITKEVTKSEAYADAIQPAAKEFGDAGKSIGRNLGEIGSTLTQAVNRALDPLRGLIWCWDNVRDYAVEQVRERFKDKPERLVTPNPVVAVPALQAMQYTASEPKLRDMYMNLLGSSMDKQTAHSAHPAFVETIKHLTPDEARILESLRKFGVLPILRVGIIEPGTPSGHVSIMQHFSHVSQNANCSHPELDASYLENICRLGLAELKISWRLSAPGVYEPLVDDPRLGIVRKVCSSLERELAITQGLIQITEFGRQFCDACMSPTLESNPIVDGKQIVASLASILKSVPYTPPNQNNEASPSVRSPGMESE